MRGHSNEATILEAENKSISFQISWHLILDFLGSRNNVYKSSVCSKAAEQNNLGIVMNIVVSDISLKAVLHLT